MEQNTHLKQTKLELHLFFGWFFTQKKTKEKDRPWKMLPEWKRS